MRSAAIVLSFLLAACGGGGGSGQGGPLPPPATRASLSVLEVQRVIAQAAAEAKARNTPAHIAVVDRVGNALGIFRMTGAPTTVTITSGLGVTGGFEGATVQTTMAVISKAVTAAFLSSNGNAFTTRTASQIVQEHFNPQENQQPSGPLYGVQFSQLACSDVIQSLLGSPGPRPAPLGLSGDPGAVPLYKAGVLVGAIAVEADGIYGIDRDITNVDASPEEAMAVAGSFGFEAPADIRADRITADGRTLRFTDAVSLASDPANAPGYATLDGQLVGAPPYSAPGLGSGTTYGESGSGVRPATADPNGAYVLVDGSGAERFPVRVATDGKLAASEVQAILDEAMTIARRARGQIRRPLGSSAEVSITVVDTKGAILGLVRTPDAPVFGIDVAVQKARTAAYFSGDVADLFASPLYTIYPVHQPANVQVDLGAYMRDAAMFLGDANAFRGTRAWSARAMGNLHRPYYPDGIAATPKGPFSTPIERWSPFNVGFQEDLVYNAILVDVGGSMQKGCVGRLPRPGFIMKPSVDYSAIANGIQIFPGSVPIYRGSELVGAIGVSGDGVDQDDMIAFLGLANAGKKLTTGIGNAPVAMRSDTYTPMGTRLRYVQCPQSPFNNSTEQNVCEGL